LKKEKRKEKKTRGICQKGDKVKLTLFRASAAALMSSSAKTFSSSSTCDEIKIHSNFEG
jgi:hypothetical protein